MFTRKREIVPMARVLPLWEVWERIETEKTIQHRNRIEGKRTFKPKDENDKIQE